MLDFKRAYEDIKERFLNLRTVEGGIYVAWGLALIFSSFLATLVAFNIVKVVGVGLCAFGGFKFLSKKND